ncbi:MAG: DNA primase [Denitrovibrio sp.]|nr:MAG: DNA primase [Denitrovibrio sp.]
MNGFFCATEVEPLKIPDTKIDEILEQTDIYQLIDEVVPLKKAGNSFKGLCPFHTEKTPSFNVHPDKGYFHCFGCGEGGNSISFVMKYHNFAFPDAVRFLGERCGVTIEYDQNASQDAKDIVALHDELTIDSRKFLYSQEGKTALNYLYKRSFTDKLLEEFLVGYFPANVDTSKYVRKYDKSVLINSGLFKEGKYGLRLMFYDRVMIPVKGVTGKTIAFSGRTISDQQPKYINSPETEVFKKRRVLYNMDKAKQFLRKSEFAMVVEGYFDVMRLSEYGFGNCVASMGTSLTSEHISLLRRYTGDIYMLFDGDQAGYNSALKSLETFLMTDTFPYVVFLPEGEDPDSFLAKHGKDGFEQMLGEKKDLFLFAAEALLKKSKDFNAKLRSLDKIKNLLVSVKSPYRKDHYAAKLSAMYQVDENTLRKDIDISAAKTTLRRTEYSAQNGKTGNRSMTYFCERDFVAALVQLPEDVSLMMTENILPEYFNDRKMSEIYKKVLEVLENGDNINVLLSTPDIAKELSPVLVSDLNSDLYRTAAASREKILANSIRESMNRKIKDTSDMGEKRRLLIEKFRVKKQSQEKTEPED